MLLFCPSCSNVLNISVVPPLPGQSSSDPASDEGSNRLECMTCPYQYVLRKRYYERKNFVHKEREDIFGGADQWNDAQKNRVQCPKEGCDGSEAAFYQVQIRSADEPMTSFYRCMTCGNQWREN